LDRISAGSTPRQFEIHWRTHDDSPLSLTACCSAIRDSAGKVEYIVCTVIDSLSREFITDRTAELRNMSRFLHDTISQDLVALSYNVSYLETVAMDQSGQTHVRSALDLIDRCCRYIRVMSFMLAPPSPPEISLEASIEQYTEFLRLETGLAVTTDIDAVPPGVLPEAQLLIFAAVQKWIAQGIRTCRKPGISVLLGNRSAGTVLEMETVCVASMPLPEPRPASPHAGWALIRERARALGGEFEIGGDSSRAFVKISLPD
jgi:signal transduction histidine kinase